MTDPGATEDLAELPTCAFGLRSVVGWGTLNFMLIEGAGFALAIGAYLYLQTQTHPWPPAGSKPPDLLWGGLFTLLLVGSELPNRWLAKRARQGKEGATRWGLVVMCVIGAVLLGLRALELGHLNVRWSDNGYASVLWLLIFLHTTHVLTDLGDSIVLCAWLFTHEVGDSQYSDVVDNASYWDFVIVTWLPIWALIYWAPRLW